MNKSLLFIFGLLACAFSVFSQTNAVTAPVVQAAGGTVVLLTVIPLLVPILIALSKLAIPKVPSWTLPIVAPALGALIDYIGSFGGSPAHPIAAALLGSAGVGLREIVDQVKNRNRPTPADPQPKT